MQLTLNPLDQRWTPRAPLVLGKLPLPNPDQAGAVTSPLAFYSVDIVLRGPEEDQIHGEDRVDLSRQALDIVTTGGYPQVAGMRAPARFPTLNQMTRLRAQV